MPDTLPYMLIDGVTLTDESVPEPSSLVLLVAGVGGAAVFALRRRARARPAPDKVSGGTIDPPIVRECGATRAPAFPVSLEPRSHGVRRCRKTWGRSSRPPSSRLSASHCESRFGRDLRAAGTRVRRPSAKIFRTWDLRPLCLLLPQQPLPACCISVPTVLVAWTVRRDLPPAFLTPPPALPLWARNPRGGRRRGRLLLGPPPAAMKSPSSGISTDPSQRRGDRLPGEHPRPSRGHGVGPVCGRCRSMSSDWPARLRLGHL